MKFGILSESFYQTEFTELNVMCTIWALEIISHEYSSGKVSDAELHLRTAMTVKIGFIKLLGAPFLFFLPLIVLIPLLFFISLSSAFFFFPLAS